MRSFIMNLILMTIVSSCVFFTGELKVNKTLSLYHENQGRLYRHVLAPNNYKAGFHILNRKTAQLIFTDRHERVVTIDMKIPYSVRVPRDNGTFYIPSYETAQLYNISGSVQTSKVVDHTTYYGIEDCYKSEERYTCRYECGPRYCGDVCRWRTVKVAGDQHVEFNKIEVTRTTSLSFKSPNNHSTHGQFSGQSKSEERSYTYRGYCRLR